MISKVPCVLSSQIPFNVDNFEHRWDPGGNHRVPSPTSAGCHQFWHEFGCHQFWHEFAICELIIPPPSHIKIGFILRLWSPLIWIFSDIAHMDFYSASTELGDRHIQKSSNIIHKMNFPFLFTYIMIMLHNYFAGQNPKKITFTSNSAVQALHLRTKEQYPSPSYNTRLTAD